MRGVRERAIGVGLALLWACGGMTHGRPPAGSDSETHFLTLCDGNCPGDLDCLCGVCTIACEEDASCERFGGGASCRAPATSGACGEAAPAAVCEATCRRDADCAALGPDHTCEGGACRAPKASTPEPRACGVDTMPVQTAQKSVAWSTVYDASPVHVAAAHEAGVAFVDGELRVFFQRDGAAAPELVWQPETPIEGLTFTSLATDGQAIYWTSGRVETSLPAEPSTPAPPSTVERVAIDGSGHAVLVESADTAYGSLSVDAEAVYFADSYGRAGLHRIDKNGGAVIEVIPELREPYSRDGDTFYWLSSTGLFRAALEGDAELLLERDGDIALDTADRPYAHRGGVLFVVDDPSAAEGTPKQTIARYDVAMDCLRLYALPSSGVTYSLLPDGGSVYWKGFDHGRAVSPGSPLPEAWLWRTDLASGESTELVPEDGLSVTAVLDLLAQDAEAIYAYDSASEQFVRIAK